MRIFRLCLLVLILFPFSVASAAGPLAFGNGETFVYRVSWGLFSNAGLAVIAAEWAEEEGENLVRITMDMEAHGVLRRFYPLDTRSLVLLENDTGRILQRREVGYDGRNGVDSETAFDYVARLAVFTDRLRPERNQTVEIPAGEELTDLIFGLIQARHWNMRAGEERNLLVYASRDIYPLVVRAEGYEEVRTSTAFIKALLLVPRMRTEPKGIFERGGDIKVWIAEDSEPLPVRMQLRLGSITVTLTLISHDPGQQAASGEPEG
jgi:hypothetical protein